MVLQGIKVRIFTTLPHTPLIWLACCI
jgi:hypothetical protein